jgi:glycosyltransferase involved in cell wall biosynthesis
MAQGAPVVAAKATSLPEIYGPAAEYFDPKITFDMAQKISRVISDTELRGQLIKTGRAQAAKYSWQTTAKQTLEIYKKALSR